MRVKLAIAAVLAVMVGVVVFSSVHAEGMRAADGRVPVLLYHKIVADRSQMPIEISAHDFQRQMWYLRWRGFYCATPDELRALVIEGRPLPKRAVMITFDDGYEGNYTIAYPILKRYRARATMFLTTSMVDRPGYLTTDQISEMAASGLVEFENHTDALHRKDAGGHSLVLTSTSQALVADLTAANAKLQRWTGRRPSAFAYPYGFYDDRVPDSLDRAGLDLAFTVEPGYIRPGSLRHRLHRFAVLGPEPSFMTFIGIVEGLDSHPGN